jgi:hypothetical protein
MNTVARVRRLYKTGIGLTTGFIGSHTVTHNYSVYTLTASQFTIVLTESSYNYNWLTTPAEFFQSPGPPADPTGSHWPSTNSSGLFSATHCQLTRNWNCPCNCCLHASKQAVSYCWHSPAWLFLM